MYLNPENCGNPMSRQTSNRVSQIDEEGNVILLEQDIRALLAGAAADRVQRLHLHPSLITNGCIVPVLIDNRPL